MNRQGSVGVPQVAVLNSIRIATDPRIVENPLDVRSVCARVRSWLDLPQTVMVHPGDRHAEILFDLLAAVGSGGNLTTDGHLVALKCALLHVPGPRAERDALIAATAMVHGMTVVTGNVADFEVTGAAVVDPWAGA